MKDDEFVIRNATNKCSRCGQELRNGELFYDHGILYARAALLFRSKLLPYAEPIIFFKCSKCGYIELTQKGDQ